MPPDFPAILRNPDAAWAANCAQARASAAAASAIAFDKHKDAGLAKNHARTDHRGVVELARASAFASGKCQASAVSLKGYQRVWRHVAGHPALTTRGVACVAGHGLAWAFAQALFMTHWFVTAAKMMMMAIYATSCADSADVDARWSYRDGDGRECYISGFATGWQSTAENGFSHIARGLADYFLFRASLYREVVCFDVLAERRILAGRQKREPQEDYPARMKRGIWTEIKRPYVKRFCQRKAGLCSAAGA